MTLVPSPCDAFDAALPDALDGALTADARAAFDAHRATCERCAALASDLEVLMHNARHLPELAPSHDLWPGIAERIAPRVLDLPTRPAVAEAVVVAARSRLWPRVAAAAALVVVSVSGTVWFMRGTTASTETSVAQGPGQPPRPRPTLVSRPSADETLSGEMRVLEEAVASRALDPATAEIVRRNLAIIDRAIADARTALEKDPANSLLDEQLTRVLGKKVELMRRAALLPSQT
jgi:anti-sigma factor RsiW